MQACCVIETRLAEVLVDVRWMEVQESLNSRTAFTRAGVSGVAIEHENVQDNTLHAIHYIYSSNAH